MKYLVEKLFKLAGQKVPPDDGAPHFLAFRHGPDDGAPFEQTDVNVTYRDKSLSLMGVYRNNFRMSLELKGAQWVITGPKDAPVIHAPVSRSAAAVLTQCFVLGYPGVFIGLLRQAMGDADWQDFFHVQPK